MGDGDGGLRCPKCGKSKDVWRLPWFVDVSGNTNPMGGLEGFLAGWEPGFADYFEEVRPKKPKKPWILKLLVGLGITFLRVRYLRYEYAYLSRYGVWEKADDFWNRAHFCLRDQTVFFSDTGGVMTMTPTEFHDKMKALMED